MKTLKDIESDEISIYDDYSKEGVIEGYTLRLKAEAIKWLKERNLRSDDWVWNKFGDIETLNKIPVSDWIKHFFNITDEDLK